jgi:putative tricarboxylic transport membrane protein
MLIHGVRPGPLILVEFPTFIYEVVAMVLMSTFAMFILGLSMVKSLVKVLMVPRQKLMPIIFTLCVVGSFAIQSRLLDRWIIIILGLIGFILREMEYPMAPLVLGIILGDILDKNLRRALVLSNGDITPFFTRPICVGLFLLTVFIVLSRAVWFKKTLNLARYKLKSMFGKA